jgi:hypothetical protein
MEKRMATKKKLPFQFVLDELELLDPLVKPMFGCHAVYLGEKLVLFLCDSEKWEAQKGLWLPTTPELYASLAADFSTARVLALDPAQAKLNKSPWLLLPANVPEFEAQALHACELILQGDPRIGRLPKQKPLTPKRNPKRIKP